MRMTRRSFIATVAAGTVAGRLVVRRESIYGRGFNTSPLRAHQDALNLCLSQSLDARAGLIRIDDELVKWDGERFYR